MSTLIDLTAEPLQAATYGSTQRERVGFFTDTTLCIGCKACEVACKQWNQLPADGYTFTAQSYDNTQELSGDTWRHVAFVEQFDRQNGGGRWLMESDVCKHCTNAGCLDVCPTGAIIRTEFGTVLIQDDICNGCGYCVVACPFGVIGERSDQKTMGKCTLCYDRLKVGETPACAKACPTESIAFGKVDELRERAEKRLQNVQERFEGARLYLNDPSDGVGGGGSLFLLLDKPEIYGLPPHPIVPTKDLPERWRTAAIAAAALFGVVTLCASLRR